MKPTATIIACGLLWVTSAAPALAQAHHSSHARSGGQKHIYYDISEDPQSLELLALSDSGKVDGKEMMDVIDVSRSPKLMLVSTWRIDCAGERMGIVHTTHVQPGAPMEQADVSPASVSARSSAKSWRVFELACSGRGQLVERRVHRGELPDIVARFWGD